MKSKNCIGIFIQYCNIYLHINIIHFGYRNEVHSKHENNDGDIDNKYGFEMEYLRNILYEYMMGKQPMVRKSII